MNEKLVKPEMPKSAENYTANKKRAWENHMG